MFFPSNWRTHKARRRYERILGLTVLEVQPLFPLQCERLQGAPCSLQSEHATGTSKATEAHVGSQAALVRIEA